MNTVLFVNATRPIGFSSYMFCHSFTVKRYRSNGCNKCYYYYFITVFRKRYKPLVRIDEAKY